MVVPSPISTCGMKNWSPSVSFEQLVQLLHETITLVLVHDESKVEIVCGLAHQIDLLLFEELEGIAELVQDGADVASHEAHRGTGADHLHTAQP